MPDPKVRFGEGAGIPAGLIVATIAERPVYCTCTWAIYHYEPDGHTTFYLKYHNVSCPSNMRHIAQSITAA